MGQARDRRPGAIDSNREVLLATPLLLEPVVVFYLPGWDSPGSDAPSRAHKVSQQTRATPTAGPSPVGPVIIAS